MGDASKFVFSHPGQLSLAIPPWICAMSIIKSWDVNRHAVRCTGPISVFPQCKLVCNSRLRKRRFVLPYGLYCSKVPFCDVRLFTWLDTSYSCWQILHAFGCAGELKYCRNGRRAGTLMHVDCSLPLWAFFDVYGSTNKLESLGMTTSCKRCSDIVFFVLLFCVCFVFVLHWLDAFHRR